MLFYQKIFLEKKEKNLDSKKVATSKNLNIRNIYSINNLSDASDIFISGNSLLKNDEIQIRGILLNDKYIEINQREKDKIFNYFKNRNQQNSESIYGI